LKLSPEKKIHSRRLKLQCISANQEGFGKVVTRSVLMAAFDGNKISDPSALGKSMATLLGYVMGYGSSALYTPIIYDLYKKRNANGMSCATWVASFLGVTLSFVYPFQKGFPISSYLEFVVLSVQCYFILGTICFYKKLSREYAAGSAVLAVGLYSIIKYRFSEKVLSVVQIIAMLVSNYSLIPQILLNMRLKSYGWSAFTAFCCTLGNCLRIYTTWQLTKDPLILLNYIVGFLMNASLLGQSFIYKTK
jgi:mannose-P-dolichol utilization defect protein 1